ncbi:YdhR family protein [Streptomyces sp. NBC_01180]|uniref:YdhR family protein n=1 Tax=Streptomyces sp. NBC_01180 TaxID=2903763 RepID=UPI003866B1DA|nr:YdhR family protein [Streptomyces sp. NBC_01180]
MNGADGAEGRAIQKYYLRDHETGRVGGIYLFETKEAAEAYVNGPIVASVGDRFNVDGDVDIEVLKVQLTLDEA